MHPNTSGLIPLTSERAKAIQAMVKERKRLAALVPVEPIVTDDETRKKRMLKQIDLLLADMENTTAIKQRLVIGAALERLWKLVQPTAGTLKPQRQARSSRPVAEPMQPQTPQGPIAPASEPPK